jgi:hypothetical protein
MSISTVHDAGTNYMMTLANGTIAWVPKDPNNADYIRVQAWISTGGVMT